MCTRVSQKKAWDAARMRVERRVVLKRAMAAWTPLHKAFVEAIAGGRRRPTEDALAAFFTAVETDTSGIVAYVCGPMVMANLAPPLFTVNSWDGNVLSIMLHLGTVMPTLVGWSLRAVATMDVLRVTLTDAAKHPLWPAQTCNPKDPTTFLTVHNLLAAGVVLTHAQALDLEPYLQVVNKNLLSLPLHNRSVTTMPLDPVALAAAPWQLSTSWDLTLMVLTNADDVAFRCKLRAAVTKAAAEGVPAWRMAEHLCLRQPTEALQGVELRKAAALVAAGIPVRWLDMCYMAVSVQYAKPMGDFTYLMTGTMAVSWLFPSWMQHKMCVDQWAPVRKAWAVTSTAA
jgi:hypothetical protein